MKKAAGRLGPVPIVVEVGGEDKVAFGAGDGDVEKAFFLFEFVVAFGVVAGELVLGHSGDEDGVEFEAFGLVDGEDGDAGVVGGEEVEIAGEGRAVGEFGEEVGRWAGGVVVALEEFDEVIEIGVAATEGAAEGFAIVAEVAQAGFVEDALAEFRRAVGVGVFAPGGEFFGDGQEGFAVAGDEVLPVAGTGGELGAEAQEDLGGGEGVGKRAVGRAVPGGEVLADGGEVVAFEIEKAAGEVERVVPAVGGERDAEAGGVGADHREVEGDIVADEHRTLGEAGEFAEDFGGVASVGLQGFLADAVDGGGFAEWAGGTQEGLEISNGAAGDEFHRADVDDFIHGRREAGGFHIEDDDSAVGERVEQGVERIAIAVGAELGEIGEAEAAGLAVGEEFLQGGGADAAGRAQDHALQGTAVGGIEQEAEACEQVFDFLTAEEVELLDGEVGDAVAFQGVGNGRGPLVGAGEDADFPGIASGLDFLESGGDPVGFVQRVVGVIELRRGAFREGWRGMGAGAAMGKGGGVAVGDAEEGFGGAVVVLQGKLGNGTEVGPDALHDCGGI